MRHLALFCIFGLILLLGLATPNAVPAQEDSAPRLLRGLDPTIFLLDSNKVLHPIADWDTYLALGFDPSGYITVPNEELADYPIGATLHRVLVDTNNSQAYLVVHGKRIAITTEAQWASLHIDPRAVTPLAPADLARFPLSDAPFPQFYEPASAIFNPVAVWWRNMLCVDKTCWNTESRLELALDGIVTSLAIHDNDLIIGTRNTAQAEIWHFDGENLNQVAVLDGWISQIIVYRGGLGILASDTRGESGAGWVTINTVGSIETPPLPLPDGLQITDVVQDASGLWLATDSAGVWQLDAEGVLVNYNRFNSTIGGNTVFDLAIDNAGRVWASTPNRLSFWNVTKWETMSFTELFSGSGARMILTPSRTEDKMFLASVGYVGVAVFDGSRTLYTAFDHPNFADTFGAIVLDDTGNPWFIGTRHLLYWDVTGKAWFRYDPANYKLMRFNPNNKTPTPPPAMPDPRTEYQAWLQAWERPANDNGRCIHYLQSPSGGDLELRENIQRLHDLGMNWVVVNYPQRAALLQMAPLFAEAGITVVWRPFVRPYEDYPYWAEDVAYLRGLGMTPYMQIYNEPSHPQEWGDQPPNLDTYLAHVIPAYRAVYEAGGYTGLQFLDEQWFRETLRQLQAENLPLDRLFYVPHPYGLNRSPDWHEDRYAVLGFLDDARLLQEELGFVPPMIAGEGGWSLDNAIDTRYPPLNAENHRDYTVALYEWFRYGTLSNGDPLPDYLFAFCPWLLSDNHHLGAWFDHPQGDLRLTIEAVKQLPDPPRRFSWSE